MKTGRRKMWAWAAIILMLLAGAASARFRINPQSTADVGKICYFDGSPSTVCGTALAAGEKPTGATAFWYRGYIRFNITSIAGKNVDYALLYLSKDQYNPGPREGALQLQRVNDFGPSIGFEDWNIGVKETITSDVGTGSVEEQVKNAVQAEANTGSNYVAFRLISSVEDLDGTGDYTGFTWGGTSMFWMDLDVSCNSHNGCPDGTYCGSDGYCASKLGDGADCASKEYFSLSDDDVCSSGHCRDDNWDGSGEYCADSGTDCVHDGVSYDSGYELCSENTWYKTCSNGAWQSQQNCDTSTTYQTCGGGCGWQSQGGDYCSSGSSGGCFEPGWSSCNDCGEYTAWSTGASAGCNSGLASCSKACGATCSQGETIDTGEDKCISNDVYDVIGGCASTGSDCYWNDATAADSFKDDCMEDCYGDYCGGANSAHWYDYYTVDTFSNTYYDVCVDSGTSDYCASAPSYCYSPRSTSCDTANCGAQCDSSSDYSVNYDTETCSYGCDTSSSCTFTNTIDCDNTGCPEGDGTGDCVDCRCSGAKLGDVNCGLSSCSGPGYSCAAESYPNYECVEGSCGAVCDSSSDYSFNDGANTCSYGCSTSSTCNFTETESCPDYCIDDNDGGACAQTARTDPSVSETCYYDDTCSGTGCHLTSSATLRQDYCDYCAADGKHNGDYSPALTVACTYTPSGDCQDDGARYYDETPPRSDDCGTSGNSLLLTETLMKGDVWDSTSSAAYCNDNECNADCRKAEFGSHTGGRCVSGVCTCNDAPSGGATGISPENIDQDDTVTLSAVCTDANGDGDIVSCGFDTDNPNTNDVSGSLNTGYGSGTQALCTANANIASAGDVEYRVWCEDGDEDGSGLNYGAWNRDGAIRREVSIGSSSQIAIPPFTSSGSQDVWFKKVITISGSGGDGTPSSFSYTVSTSLPSGVDYWKFCEGDTSNTDCSATASGSGNNPSATVDASYTGTEYETILYRYDNGATLSVGSWAGNGTGGDGRQDVKATLTLTESVGESFAVDMDVTGTINGETSCYENCAFDDKASDGGWIATALAYGDWVTYPMQCMWTDVYCNATGGDEHITCALGNFVNTFPSPLNVTITPPALPSGSWDCSDPSDDCNQITLPVAETDDTSYTFDSFDDVVAQSEGGWADNGTCSQHTAHTKYRSEDVTLNSGAGMNLNCRWSVSPEPSYDCPGCGGTTVVPDGGRTLHVQEDKYCNSPVAIVPVPAQTATEDEFFSYDINASDADADTLTWSDKVSFGNIDSATGVWSWTPSNADVGLHNIEVTVDDARGSTDNEIWSLTVENENDPPEWGPEPQDPSVEEDAHLTYDANATDPDGDALTYSVNDTEFEMNSETGVLTWTPPGNYTGLWGIRISADDGSVMIHKAVTVNVTPVNDAPTIKEIPDQNKNEDAPAWTLDLNPHGSDVDGDPLSWTVSGFNENMINVSVDSGIATFTTQPDVWGEDQVRFNVSDGTLSGSQLITVRLAAVNDPPETSPLPNVTMQEDNTYNSIILDDYVSDIDDSDASIRWTVLSENITAYINPDTRALDLTPAKDWYGIETITFTAADSSNLTSNQTMRVTVENTPDHPALQAMEPQAATVGKRFTFQANASDPDPISFLEYFDDTPLFDIDRSTGFISFIPGQFDTGYHTIKITVYDGSSTDAGSLNLTIQEETTTTTTPTTSTTIPETTSTVTTTTLPETTTSLPDTLPGGLVTFTMQLRKGWNLVSFPVIPIQGPTCSDGMQNQNETGVDCDGPCLACHCFDGEQNENETDVDCGGECSSCEPAPTCNDGIQNQNETGVDCGGQCIACHCFDSEQNENETGVDCGGECQECPPMPPGFTSSFSDGWNLFSLPYGSQVSTAEELCSNMTTENMTVDRVKRWDTSLQSYVTHPCGSGFLDFNISPYNAYWAYIKGKAEFNHSGETVNGSAELAHGWNLLSWTSYKNTTAESWLDALSADTLVMWTGEKYTYHAHGTGYNNFTVSIGKGYWIHKNGNPYPSGVSSASEYQSDTADTEVPFTPYGILGTVNTGTQNLSATVNLTNSRTNETLSTQSDPAQSGYYEFDVTGLDWTGDNLSVTAYYGNHSNTTWVLAGNDTGSQVVGEISFASFTYSSTTTSSTTTTTSSTSSTSTTTSSSTTTAETTSSTSTTTTTEQT